MKKNGPSGVFNDENREKTGMQERPDAPSSWSSFWFYPLFQHGMCELIIIEGDDHLSL